MEEYIPKLHIHQHGFLSSLGFTKSKADSNLYYKIEEGNPVILLLYVDDLYVTSMDGLIADTKRKLAIEFEMKNLGMVHYVLGMEVWHNADGISLGQGKYAVEIPEEVWDDGLQGHDHTYGIKPEAFKWVFIRVDWCYDVSLDD